MHAETKPKLIQKIHIAKNQLGLDEFSYRAMLEMVTDKKSCKEMTVAELIKVFDHLKNRGFKVRARRNYSPTTKSAVVKSNITHKIRAMWIEMHKIGLVKDGSEHALNRFMHNTLYRNKGLHQVVKLNVQSLDDREASVFLEVLKKWRGRAI